MRFGWKESFLASVAAVCLASFTSVIVHGRQDCVTGFSPPALDIPASGTPNSFNVLTATPTCAWQYDSPSIPTWLFFPSTFAGNGPATVSFPGVMPNHTGPARSTIQSFGGQPIAITQAANPCPLTLSATTPAVLPANGGNGSFTVDTTAQGCSYAAQPGQGVTLLSGQSGNTFPATVTFSVGPNTSSAAITRSIQVSSLGTFHFSPGVGVQQNGPPVATDAPPNGYVFAVHRGGAAGTHTTSAEPLTITNSENPTASWTATTNEPWLVVSPASGVSPGTAFVSIDPAAAAVLTNGRYTGGITLTSSVAPSTPSSVRVVLSITDTASPTQAPGGFLDIPLQNQTGLDGAVPMGGWAVDDVGISRVQLFRSSAGGEPAGEIYLGDATRVRGARPDIVDVHTLPEVTRAGWGFMLLSNVLPGGGNGPFTLYAYAEDIEGRRTRIGQTTVTFDNTNSVFPFGTIDEPTQGGSLSGTAALVGGWVLAQPGKSIPFDGSTIRLMIDGVLQPHMATYGLSRPDVAAYFPFPSYVNANGAGAQFVVDTTQFANGLHTIVWVAVDDLGVAQGIGSRYFTIDNGAASQVAPAASEARSAAAVRALPQAPVFVWNRHGFDDRRWALQWGSGPTNEVQLPPGERLEVALDTWWWSKGCGPYAGHLLTGDVAGPLPPGASLDGETGVFRWLPPAEFAGTFELVFVRRACTGREERIPLRVTIAPR